MPRGNPRRFFTSIRFFDKGLVESYLAIIIYFIPLHYYNFLVQLKHIKMLAVKVWITSFHR